MSPTYITPWVTVLRLAYAILFYQKLDFQVEARRSIRHAGVPVKVYNPEYMPQSGPCLLMVNHYSRPGFMAWWFVIALSALIPTPIHWVTATAWTYETKRGERKRQPFTTWVFSRMAHAYGFTPMPPMPPVPADTLQRAEAVRSVLSYARSHPSGIIGMAPEGGDSPNGVLQQPPAGTGRFLLHLSKLGYACTPAAVYEEEQALVIRFGLAFPLQTPPGLPAEETDRAASQTVMEAIASLLPEGMQGVYKK